MTAAIANRLHFVNVLCHFVVLPAADGCSTICRTVRLTEELDDRLVLTRRDPATGHGTPRLGVAGRSAKMCCRPPTHPGPWSVASSSAGSRPGRDAG